MNRQIAKTLGKVYYIDHWDKLGCYKVPVAGSGTGQRLLTPLGKAVIVTPPRPPLDTLWRFHLLPLKGRPTY